MKLLDLIFPKYCVNCKKLEDFICTDCFSLLSFNSGKLKGEGKLDGYFVALSSNKVSRRIIRSFKNQHLSSLKDLVSRLMYESLIQNEDFMKELPGGVFIPMPIGKLTLRKRGFSESEEIAKKLSSLFNNDLKDVLEYKKGRLRFKGEHINGKTVFLVEDIPNKIRMEEASKILKGSGVVKVFGLSFIK